MIYSIIIGILFLIAMIIGIFAWTCTLDIVVGVIGIIIIVISTIRSIVRYRQDKKKYFDKE